MAVYPNMQLLRTTLKQLVDHIEAAQKAHKDETLNIERFLNGPWTNELISRAKEGLREQNGR